MQVNPYLMFAGQCEAAFRFYHRCLGGELDALFRFGESPQCGEVSAEWRDKIMHARLRLGDDVLMGSDAPPEHQETPQGFSVSLNVDDPAEAERVFGALAEGATIRMAMEETFWAHRFGMLVDAYEVPWMINCPKEDYAGA